MRIEVIAYGYLMKLIGGKSTVEVKNGASIEDLISKLTHKTKASRRGYIGPYKSGSGLMVLINGRNMNSLKRPYALSEGDVVTLIPPLVGG